MPNVNPRPGGTAFFLATALLAVAVGCADPASSVPPLPNVPVAGLAPPVADHVTGELIAVRDAPDSAVLNGRLAMVLHSYGLADAAEVAYRRAVALAPETFQWRYLHGVTLQDLARNDEAFTELRAAAKFQPGYLPLMLRVARLGEELGYAKESRNIYTKLVEAYPDVTIAHYRLGILQARDGDLAAAAASLRRAMEREPDFAAAHYALADALRRLGDEEGAARHVALFESSSKREPAINDPLMAAVRALSRSDIGRLNNALAFMRKGQVQAAVTEFESILENSPDNYSVHINLVGLYGDLGQPDEAEKHFRIARDLVPAEPTPYNNIGVVRLRAGALDSAEAAFRKAIAVDPEYARAWRNLGKTLQDSGSTDEALTSYRTAVELDGSDRQAQYFYGRLLLETGDAQAAIAPLSAAAQKVDMRTPHYLQVLATAHKALGDTQAVRRTLDEARSLAVRTKQAELIERIDEDIRTLDEVGGGEGP